MRLCFAILLGLVLLIGIRAQATEKLDSFAACSGDYQVIRVKNLWDSYKRDEVFPKQIIIEPITFTAIGELARRLEKLETYNWSEEGRFGIANFEKLPNGCSWSKRHNGGFHQIRIEAVANGVYEINEICNWGWSCKYSYQYLTLRN